MALLPASAGDSATGQAEVYHSPTDRFFFFLISLVMSPFWKTGDRAESGCPMAFLLHAPETPCRG